jgi:hypothetical protein
MVRKSFLYFTIRGDQSDGACVVADRNLSRLRRVVTAWISTVELEFVFVELMISSLRGGIPPMKMDRYQSKRVAGGTFCNRLKRNGMDDGKWREMEARRQ